MNADSPERVKPFGQMPCKVCKKLSELHMIKIEKKTVHRDDEFRDVQESI